MSLQNFNTNNVPYNETALLPKILAVEADLALGEMLCELFKSSGYDCKIVRETADIIPIMEEYRPDLVLIEYLLPLVNGGELCTQIKNNPRFSSIPVIMYSAYPQILWSVKDYGCDSFIAKPFDIDMLLLQIEKLLTRGKEKRRFSLLTNSLKDRVSYLNRFLRN